MKALLLDFPAPVREAPLHLAEIPPPAPLADQVVVKVSACALGHADLQTVEGELPLERLPIIPGHQVVGRVVETGPQTSRFQEGQRVGLGRLFHACGACPFCQSDREHLCRQAEFTGLHRDGGLAEYLVAFQDFLVPLPEDFTDETAAPLLSLGLLAFRSLRLAGLAPGGRLGLFGFGASPQLALQIARLWNCQVFVFSRVLGQQALAREMGASWTGYLDDPPPALLDGAVIFSPGGSQAADALTALNRGGTLVLAGLHLGALHGLAYERHLSDEKSVRSVTGGSRRDLEEFLEWAARHRLQPRVQAFALEEANRVLQQLKAGQLDGAGNPVLRL
ncbi:MAG: zinc-binding alcohol dehydrogenase family protein [Deltaproteobacteria bacterium]|nr:zinc-binding alcohol dehydrogenase family protein [Deltaproteobacteria bacterium]